MPTLQQMRHKRQEILALAAKYGIARVRVFGSVARGDARIDSDVDFLVAFRPKRSLLDLVGFGQDVEELLGCRVDVVSEGGINPHIEATIRREAVEL